MSQMFSSVYYANENKSPLFLIPVLKLFSNYECEKKLFELFNQFIVQRVVLKPTTNTTESTRNNPSIAIDDFIIIVRIMELYGKNSFETIKCVFEQVAHEMKRPKGLLLSQQELEYIIQPCHRHQEVETVVVEQEQEQEHPLQPHQPQERRFTSNNVDEVRRVFYYIDKSDMKDGFISFADFHSAMKSYIWSRAEDMIDIRIYNANYGSYFSNNKTNTYQY